MILDTEEIKYLGEYRISLFSITASVAKWIYPENWTALYSSHCVINLHSQWYTSTLS